VLKTLKLETIFSTAIFLYYQGFQRLFHKNFVYNNYNNNIILYLFLTEKILSEETK